MASNSNFNVSVTKNEVVAAALPVQEPHYLPHSNLDLLLPPVDVGVFFCYQKPAAASAQTTTEEHATTFGWMVNTLKAALSEALVSFYALAGEVEQNLAGEPELICNNRGVDFVQAFADVELRKLNLYKPDDSVEGKLVPKKKQGVLSVQATELKCGGIVVAVKFDHRVADAYSANMFLVSWSEIAQAKQLSQLPCFRRSFLFPRRPAHYDLSLDNMYVPISSLQPEAVEEPKISRIYCVAAEQIRELQSQANHYSADELKHPRRTKLEAFCAFLWKTVASGKSRRNFKNFKLGIVVDGRTRLSIGDENKAKFLQGYFGNVLSFPFEEKTIKELREKPLSWVASAVHEFLEEALTGDHFLGLIDWVEAHRPEPAIPKVHDCVDGAALVVSSGQRFPVRKIDFGWGKPAFGSYHFPWGGQSGYVMPMPSPKGNGDWIVYMHLQKEKVELIETYASHVFKPFTSDHLNFN
ncbi:PREDICTED: shikimate O-hydroxycinnamoyltransferase-like [Ipomoea nil]|uniref:shikimate O-hydroxycinnamoyltransferase-like n=1 Tax=Ipomoea nil TaxID=35883 RepID=UPI000901B07E|nr:PREDICTED: shikimate O-hydroxycinnamoyltransferase-like [Ipomoea nil]